MSFRRPARAFVGLLLSISTIGQSFAQVAIDPRQPFFRFNGQQNSGTTPPTPDQNSTLLVSGVGGDYLARQGNTPAIPTPSSSLNPATWTVSGTLPTGMGFDASGAVTGVAGSVGSFTRLQLVAHAQDATGRDVSGSSAPFSLTVLGQPLTLAYDSATASANNPFVMAPRARNVSPAATYTVTGLPTGLAIDRSTGVISGTATTAGNATGLVVKVRDFDGLETQSQPFSITVSQAAARIAINGNDAILGVPYTNRITNFGLVGHIDYTVLSSGGKLPDGLQAVSTPSDTIAGTPQVAGSFPGIVVVAKDANGVSVPSPAFTINVQQPSISYAGGDIVVGKAFTINPTLQYLSNATFLPEGTMPDGVTVSPSTGAVSGKLSQTGPATFKVTATLGDQHYPSNLVTLRGIASAYTVSAPATYVTAHVGYPVDLAFTATSPSTPIVWSAAGSPLPDGLSLNSSTGHVTGITYAATSVTGAITRARDAAGTQVDSDGVTYQILPLPGLAPSDGYSAPLNQQFSTVLAANNLIGSGSYATDQTLLPPGLKLSPAGVLSGTPTQAGTYPGIVVTVVDAYDGSTGTGQPFTVTVRDVGTDLTADNVQSTYRVRQGNALAMPAPVALNAVAPVAWSLAPGSPALPNGLRIDPATGIVSGSPTISGTTSGYKLRLSDASGRPAALSQPFSILVADPLAVANVAPSYALKLATALDVSPTATGRIGNTTWELSGGALPQALAFDPTIGRIAGAPLVSGRIPVPSTSTLRAQGALAASAPAASTASTSAYVLRVTDAFDGAVATSQPFEIVVGAGLVILGPSSYTGTVNLPFTTSGTYSVQGSTGQLVWSLTSGTLPDGLTLNGQTGLISGTPTAPAVAYNLRLQAIDTTNDVTGTSAPFSIAVSGGLVARAPAVVYAHVNKSYPYLVPTVTGNNGPVSWNIATGGLPPGLTLASDTGIVSGAPLSSGSFTSIRLGVRDSAGRVGLTDEITFAVNDNPVWASPAVRIPNGRYGTKVGPYAAPRIDGAVGKVTFSMAVGGYSVWGSNQDFTVDPDTGVIQGTIGGKAYNSDFMYQGWVVATDAAGGVAQAPATETFASKPPLVFGDCDGYDGTRLCTTLATPNVATSVIPGYAAYTLGTVTYSFPPGSTPASWIKLDGTTGVVSGVPTAAGDYPYVLRITDIDGATADHNRLFNVVDFNKPVGDVTVTVRNSVAKTVPSIVPPVTAPDGGPAAWAASTPGYNGFMLSIQANGNALDAVWGGFSYYYGPGVWTNNIITARAADGTLLQSTNVTVNILPAVSPDVGKNVCARYGETFDTGPRSLGNIFGQARVEPWWNSSPTTLPDWLKLDPATGRLSGTAPSYDYSNYFEPRVYDTYDGANAYGPFGGRQYFEVWGPLSLLPPQNVTMTELQGYDETVRNSGGSYYRSFSVTGTLPPGINFSTRYGEFSGTPTQAGTYPVTVTMKPETCGSPPLSTNVVFTVNPAIRPYALVPSTMYFRQGLLSRSPDGTIVGGGTENYAWSSYSLYTPGLNVDTGSGAVYGIPSNSGIGNGRIQAMNTTTRNYLVSNTFQTVVLPPPTLTMPATNRAVLGDPVRISPSAVGFVGGLTWSSTALPPGLGIDQTDGSVFGTPTAAGTTDGLAVRASETSSPGVDTSGKPIPPAGLTSNAFSIQVVAKPVLSVTPVVGNTNAALAMQPQATNVTGQATWGSFGIIPAGFSVDPATGRFSGTSAAPVSTTLRLTVTDSATGLSATSDPFQVLVTQAQAPARPTQWTWADQICTYAKADGTYAGRQMQVCSGDGCSSDQRGCAVPYAGGETSYPVGLTATTCTDPTLPPTAAFCPGSSARGTWLYQPTGVQDVPTSCITVTSYQLGCFASGSSQPQADTSMCGPAPTQVTQCRLNDKGKGSCQGGIGFTDGKTLNGFDDGTAWFNTNYCPTNQPSVTWAYIKYANGIGPSQVDTYGMQCTKDKWYTAENICGPKPDLPATCSQGATSITSQIYKCPSGIPTYYTPLPYWLNNGQIGCMLAKCSTGPIIFEINN